MKKVAVVAGIGIAVIAVIVGFLIINVNSVVKNGIEAVGTEVLGVPVTVEDVNISFLNGSGVIKGLNVANPDGYESEQAIMIEEMRVIVDIGSLTSDKIHIKEVVIDAPSITYEGNLLNSNISKLQKNAESTGTSGSGSSDEADEEGEMALQIDRLQVNDARINVRLSFLDDPLSLVLPFLELEDLGKDEDASPGDVINEVLLALNQSVVPLIRDNASLGDKLKETGEKIGEKLKGLFKRD